MNEQKKPIDYTAWEYKQVTASIRTESLWADSMTNFGWTVESRHSKMVKRLPLALWIMAAPLSLLPGRPFRKQMENHDSANQVELTFKRDRTLRRNRELNQLQTQFEHCAQAIDSLDMSERTAGALTGWLTGLAGTVLLGAAVFAYLAGMTPICFIPAVLGFACWLLAGLFYAHAKERKEADAEQKIAEQADAIYQLCEAASDILHAA